MNTWVRPHVSFTPESGNMQVRAIAFSLLSASSPSSVGLHTSNCDVCISGSDFKVLSSCERSPETLLFLESMFILKYKPKINNIVSAH